MTDDPNNIPQDGIWARIQQPALMRDNNPGGKRVDTIEAIDKRGDNSMTIWDRPSKLRLRGEEFKIVEGEVLDDEVLGSNSVLESRQDDRCFTPEQIDDWFGDVPF